MMLKFLIFSKSLYYPQFKKPNKRYRCYFIIPKLTPIDLRLRFTCHGLHDLCQVAFGQRAVVEVVDPRLLTDREKAAWKSGDFWSRPDVEDLGAFFGTFWVAKQRELVASSLVCRSGKCVEKNLWLKIHGVN